MSKLRNRSRSLGDIDYLSDAEGHSSIKIEPKNDLNVLSTINISKNPENNQLDITVLQDNIRKVLQDTIKSDHSIRNINMKIEVITTTVTREEVEKISNNKGSKFELPKIIINAERKREPDRDSVSTKPSPLALSKFPKNIKSTTSHFEDTTENQYEPVEHLLEQPNLSSRDSPPILTNSQDSTDVLNAAGEYEKTVRISTQQEAAVTENECDQRHRILSRNCKEQKNGRSFHIQSDNTKENDNQKTPKNLCESRSQDPMLEPRMDEIPPVSQSENVINTTNEDSGTKNDSTSKSQGRKSRSRSRKLSEETPSRKLPSRKCKTNENTKHDSPNNSPKEDADQNAVAKPLDFEEMRIDLPIETDLLSKKPLVDTNNSRLNEVNNENSVILGSESCSPKDHLKEFGITKDIHVLLEPLDLEKVQKIVDFPELLSKNTSDNELTEKLLLFESLELRNVPNDDMFSKNSEEEVHLSEQMESEIVTNIPAILECEDATENVAPQNHENVPHLMLPLAKLSKSKLTRRNSVSNLNEKEMFSEKPLSRSKSLANLNEEIVNFNFDFKDVATSMLDVFTPMRITRSKVPINEQKSTENMNSVLKMHKKFSFIKQSQISMLDSESEDEIPLIRLINRKHFSLQKNGDDNLLDKLNLHSETENDLSSDDEVYEINKNMRKRSRSITPEDRRKNMRITRSRSVGRNLLYTKSTIQDSPERTDILREKSDFAQKKSRSKSVPRKILTANNQKLSSKKTKIRSKSVPRRSLRSHLDNATSNDSASGSNFENNNSTEEEAKMDKRRRGRPLRSRSEIRNPEIAQEHMNCNTIEEDGKIEQEKHPYKLGSFVWAQIGKCPFWPAMVCEDPVESTWVKKGLSFKHKHITYKYHVRFFNDNGKRAWIPESHLMMYCSKDDLTEMADKLQKLKIKSYIRYLKPNHPQSWIQAVEELELMKQKSSDEIYDHLIHSYVKHYNQTHRVRKSWPSEDVPLITVDNKDLKVEDFKESNELKIEESTVKNRTVDNCDKLNRSEIEESTAENQTKPNENVHKESTNNEISNTPDNAVNEELTANHFTSVNEDSSQNETEVMDSQPDSPEVEETPASPRKTRAKSISEVLSVKMNSEKQHPSIKITIKLDESGLHTFLSTTTKNEAFVDSIKPNKHKKKSSRNQETTTNCQKVLSPEVSATRPLRRSLPTRLVAVKTQNIEDDTLADPDFLRPNTNHPVSKKRKTIHMDPETIRSKRKKTQSEEMVNAEGKTHSGPNDVEKSRRSSERKAHSETNEARTSDNYSFEYQVELHRKNNPFIGLSKTKVCHYCLQPGKVLRCKGKCGGYFHTECASKVMLPRPPQKTSKQVKKPRRSGGTPTAGTPTNGSEKGVRTSDTDSTCSSLSSEKVQIVDVHSKLLTNLSNPIVSCLPPTFNELTLNEQIDDRMKEMKLSKDSVVIVGKGVMSRFDEQVTYADSSSTDTSSEEGSHVSLAIKKRGYLRSTAEKQVSTKNDKSGGKNDEMSATGTELNDKLLDSNGFSIPQEKVVKHVTADSIIMDDGSDPPSFKCEYCRSDKYPPCNACELEVSLKGDPSVHKCSQYHCNKTFHKSCLKMWPQGQWSIGKWTKDQNSQDMFTCPSHVCHTCFSEELGEGSVRLPGDKLAKCLLCPASYHASTFCLPAGSEVLGASQLICPRHRKTTQPLNTNWCFICSEGGNLVCCDMCPTSVHPECQPVNFTDDDKYICEDCESGRFPLYDEVVWVKLGSYRWWPALVLFPNEVPVNMLSLKHQIGDFAVRFFGTNDHYWVSKSRSFLFQEGDRGGSPEESLPTKKKFYKLFDRAIEDAAIAYQAKKDFKLRREAETLTSLKPPSFVKTVKNKPIGNVKPLELDLSNTTACECDPEGPTPCGPETDCINRLLLTECDPELCPANARCRNQSFEKREYPPIVPYKTQGRGWGLRNLALIKKGQFVIEYVGDLIDQEEYQRRIKKMHETKEENYYFMTLDNDRMIDAGPKGNLSRFMNHSCNPNCETQKWTVKGDTRVGLFALKNIEAGSELTFNYNLECVGQEKKSCKCGAPNCSGFIGVKAKPEHDSDSCVKPMVKSRKNLKKRSTVTPLLACFICSRKGGDKISCTNKHCHKNYHLKCLQLNEPPELGKYVCPRHICNLCTNRTIRCCVKCINSFCPSHSEGNIRHEKLLGFVCRLHDPQNSPHEKKTHVSELTDEQRRYMRKAWKIRKRASRENIRKRLNSSSEETLDELKTRKRPKENDSSSSDVSYTKKASAEVDSSKKFTKKISKQNNKRHSSEPKFDRKRVSRSSVKKSETEENVLNVAQNDVVNTLSESLNAEALGDVNNDVNSDLSATEPSIVDSSNFEDRDSPKGDLNSRKSRDRGVVNARIDNQERVSRSSVKKAKIMVEKTEDGASNVAQNYVVNTLSESLSAEALGDVNNDVNSDLSATEPSIVDSSNFEDRDSPKGDLNSRKSRDRGVVNDRIDNQERVSKSSVKKAKRMVEKTCQNDVVNTLSESLSAEALGDVNNDANSDLSATEPSIADSSNVEDRDSPKGDLNSRKSRDRGVVNARIEKQERVSRSSVKKAEIMVEKAEDGASNVAQNYVVNTLSESLSAEALGDVNNDVNSDLSATEPSIADSSNVEDRDSPKGDLNSRKSRDRGVVNARIEKQERVSRSSVKKAKIMVEKTEDGASNVAQNDVVNTLSESLSAEALGDVNNDVNSDLSATEPSIDDNSKFEDRDSPKGDLNSRKSRDRGVVNDRIDNQERVSRSSVKKAKRMVEKTCQNDVVNTLSESLSAEALGDVNNDVNSDLSVTEPSIADSSNVEDRDSPKGDLNSRKSRDRGVVNARIDKQERVSRSSAKKAKIMVEKTEDGASNVAQNDVVNTLSESLSAEALGDVNNDVNSDLSVTEPSIADSSNVEDRDSPKGDLNSRKSRDRGVVNARIDKQERVSRSSVKKAKIMVEKTEDGASNVAQNYVVNTLSESLSAEALGDVNNDVNSDLSATEPSIVDSSKFEDRDSPKGDLNSRKSRDRGVVNARIEKQEPVSRSSVKKAKIMVEKTEDGASNVAQNYVVNTLSESLSAEALGDVNNDANSDLSATEPSIADSSNVEDRDSPKGDLNSRKSRDRGVVNARIDKQERVSRSSVKKAKIMVEKTEDGASNVAQNYVVNTLSESLSAEALGDVNNDVNSDLSATEPSIVDSSNFEDRDSPKGDLNSRKSRDRGVVNDRIDNQERVSRSSVKKAKIMVEKTCQNDVVNTLSESLSAEALGDVNNDVNSDLSATEPSIVDSSKFEDRDSPKGDLNSRKSRDRGVVNARIEKQERVSRSSVKKAKIMVEKTEDGASNVAQNYVVNTLSESLSAEALGDVNNDANSDLSATEPSIADSSNVEDRDSPKGDLNSRKSRDRGVVNARIEKQERVSRSSVKKAKIMVEKTEDGASNVAQNYVVNTLSESLSAEALGDVNNDVNSDLSATEPSIADSSKFEDNDSPKGDLNTRISRNRGIDKEIKRGAKELNLIEANSNRLTSRDIVKLPNSFKSDKKESSDSKEEEEEAKNSNLNTILDSTNTLVDCDDSLTLKDNRLLKKMTNSKKSRSVSVKLSNSSDSQEKMDTEEVEKNPINSARNSNDNLASEDTSSRKDVHLSEQHSLIHKAKRILRSSLNIFGQLDKKSNLEDVSLAELKSSFHRKRVLRSSLMATEKPSTNRDRKHLSDNVITVAALSRNGEIHDVSKPQEVAEYGKKRRDLAVEDRAVDVCELPGLVDEVLDDNLLNVSKSNFMNLEPNTATEMDCRE